MSTSPVPGRGAAVLVARCDAGLWDQEAAAAPEPAAVAAIPGALPGDVDDPGLPEGVPDGDFFDPGTPAESPPPPRPEVGRGTDEPQTSPPERDVHDSVRRFEAPDDAHREVLT